MKSRYASAAATSTSAVAAASRAPCTASPLRRSVLDGMHAPYERSPPTSSRSTTATRRPPSASAAAQCSPRARAGRAPRAALARRRAFFEGNLVTVIARRCNGAAHAASRSSSSVDRPRSRRRAHNVLLAVLARGEVDRRRLDRRVVQEHAHVGDRGPARSSSVARCAAARVSGAARRGVRPRRRGSSSDRPDALGAAAARRV
jgi:hypothetical protein